MLLRHSIDIFGTTYLNCSAAIFRLAATSIRMDTTIASLFPRWTHGVIGKETMILLLTVCRGQTKNRAESEVVGFSVQLRTAPIQLLNTT